MQTPTFSKNASVNRIGIARRFLLYGIALGLLGIVSPQSINSQTTNAAPYCNPPHNSQNCSLSIGIGRVKIFSASTGTVLDHTPSCIAAPGYTFFNNLSVVQLTPGHTYNWEVHALPTMTTSYTNQMAMWIDYNGNNVFDEINSNGVAERLVSAPNSTTGPQVGPPTTWNPPFQSGTFTVPMNATSNTTRLRVRSWNSRTLPVTGCSSMSYGMALDYAVMVAPPTPDPSPVGLVVANPGSTTPINPPVGAGTYDAGFILQNVTGGTLTAVTVDYTITGPQNFSGTIPWTGSLASGSSVYVPLASNIVLDNPLQPYSVTVTLTNSVGTQGPGDGNLANNSLSGSIAMALNGSADPLNPSIYYVGGTPVPGQWFSNLTDVGGALTYGGILGAVEFRIRPGTYNEQMLIGQISQTVQGVPGSSGLRPITFTADAAAGGNVNNVIVSSANSAINNHTVQLNAADNMTFRNITFSINPSATAGRNFWLRNGTDNITISNCAFIGRQNIIGGANDALIYSEPTNVPTNLIISNNTFTNGDIGIMIDGGTSGNAINNTIISGNTLNSFYTQGIYLQRTTAPVITNNIINASLVNPVGAFGINCDRVLNNAVIARNRILMTTIGTGIRYSINTGNTSLPVSISNNMINVGDGSSSPAMGIAIVNSNNTNVFHNTVNVNTPASSTAAAFHISSSVSTNLRVVNNIFYNRGLGYAYYIAVSGLPTQSNYNNLFTTGANLGWHTSANRANLSAFRTATFEPNSISMPLNFTGTTSTFINQPELQLRGTNSYNNASIGNVSDDYNMVSRMNPPYMGAHELVPLVTFASGPVDSTCTGGDITLNSQPIIKTIVDGVTTTLYDATTGAPAPSWISFRWTKGGSPIFDQVGKISGSRTMNLTIASTNFFDGDTYSMIAMIKDGSALRDNPIDTLFYSYAVTLKINEPVEIRRNPLSQVVCRAGVVSLNVIASQGTIWGYQWYKDGQPLTDGNNVFNAQRVEGSRSVNLVMTGVDYQVSGRYMCMLQTSCGESSVPTEEAVVYIARPTKIGTAPMSQVVSSGGTARFEVKVAELTEGPNINPVKYAWYKGTQQIKDSPRISGAGGSVLTIRNVGVNDVGSNYYVKVIGACGNDSSQVFALAIGSITVNTQPASADVCEGSDAVLTVSATPNGAQGLSLGYQWRKGTVNLSEGGRYIGTQSSSLTINDVEAADAGAYNCVISLNPGAIVTETSTDAALTVKPGVSFVNHPQPAIICEGQPAELTVEAAGSGTLTYQWQLNGTDIVGATDAKYSIAAMKGTDAGNYSVAVTGDCGTKVSQLAMLRMKTKPVVYGPTESKLSIKAGGFLRLAVATVSDRSTKYQWYRGSTAITNDSISNAVYMKFGVATGTDAGKYYCVVTNDCGSTHSDTVDITVTTEVSGVEEENVHGVYLKENEPNPFSGTTTIRFNVPQRGTAQLTISDNFGRQLAVIADGVYSGEQSIEFDPSVLGLSSGVYNYTLTTNGQSLTKKMIFVK